MSMPALPDSVTSRIPDTVTNAVPEELAEYFSIMLTSFAAFFALFFVVALFVGLAMNWRIFKKAGYCGILSLIPIVNAFLFTKIIFGHAWMLFLYLIPGVNVILALIAPFRFARVFGRGFFFGIGTLFFPTIFMAVAAFGDLDYQG